MTPDQQLELAVYAKVYEAILTAPITSAFREDGPGSEDEAPPDDPEMVVAIRADRFGLMTRIREMRLAAALGAAPAPQCPKGDPRRAAALQRARDRTAGVLASDETKGASDGTK